MSKRTNRIRLGLIILVLGLILISAEDKGCMGWHAPYEEYEGSISGSSGLPTAPSYLIGSPASHTQINLIWTDNASTEAGFGVEYKTAVGESYSLIATLGPDTITYSHTNLAVLTTYYYRVYAFNAAGNSAYSNQVLVTTPDVPPPPNVPLSPSDLTAEAISSSEIKLTWTDNADNEDGFYLERKIDAGGTYVPITTLGTDVTIYYNTELTPDTTYFYRVEAFNIIGNSADYTNEVEIPTPPGDYWSETSTIVTNAPAKRDMHTAIWTGTEMIVWGGYSGFALDTGGKYAPASGTWTTVSTTSAPLGRRYHTAVWTEEKMIVWGGQDEWSEPALTGGIYYPVTDTWTATTIFSAPTGRWNHTAVWTGDGTESWHNKMIVWGGRDIGLRMATGGIYDPELNSWFAITSTLTDTPSAREHHTAVWTGDGGQLWRHKMIVWGGSDGFSYLDTGGKYDPANNSWQPISTDNAPSARYYHSAIWTDDNKMIVWGGYDGGYTDTGGIYDPADDSWETIPVENAPSGRYDHTMVWTKANNEVIIWGGRDGTNYFNTGGRYHTGFKAWTPIYTTNAPSGRTNHSAVWNDSASQMIVWGGNAGNYFNNGGVYTPTANAWSLLSGSSAPLSRTNHTTVWTGKKMIVWGGQDGTDYLNTGGIYTQADDSWDPLPTTTLDKRANHSVVWTGSKMIVWGGYDGSTWLNSGGLYNLAYNTWSDTADLDAPSAREGHTAVWTGKVIIWGGKDGSSYFNDGKAYDLGDVWTDITSTNAPSTRTNHTAIWTGDKMVVWGGYDGSSYLDTGAIYDPISDTWTTVSTVYAPAPRANHTAIWTDSRMLIWGGNDESSWFNTGAVYDPEANLWTANIIILDAPAERANHTAIWTGHKMIVWGGYNGSSYLNTAGVYDLAGNYWMPLTTTNAPSGRRFHSAIWSGTKMIIWGGEDGSAYLNSGGRYQQ